MNGLTAAEQRRAAWAIARRDLLEFVRDRRTLFITLLMPMVMYPVLALSSMLGIRGALSDIDARQSQGTLRIFLAGPDAEPFAARLRAIAADPGRAGRDDWPAKLELEVVGPDLDPEDRAFAARAAAADLLLVIPADGDAALDGGGTLRLDPRFPPGRTLDRIKRGHLAAVMRSVAEDVRQRRIRTAGLPDTTLTPLQMEFPDAGESPTRQATREVFPVVAGAVLVLLSLLTATGAFYPAIDAIAGEKERGTVETLLIAPCGVGDIVRGKFLAVFAVTLATLVMNAVSIGLTASVLFRQLPAESRAPLGSAELATAVAVTVVAFTGLAAVAASLSLAVTAAAKSVKEAQNTLTPVILLVSGLAGAAMLPGRTAPGLIAAVPFAGQIAVAQAAVQPQSRPDRLLGMLGVSLLSSAALTWILLRATAVVIGDEGLLFRGPDTAAGPLRRPPRRQLPTGLQAAGCVVAGLALIWYAQGLPIRDLTVALPVQQIVTLLLPLAAVSWWQRIAARPTFAVRLPVAGAAVRSLPCPAGRVRGTVLPRLRPGGLCRRAACQGAGQRRPRRPGGLLRRVPPAPRTDAADVRPRPPARLDGAAHRQPAAGRRRPRGPQFGAGRAAGVRRRRDGRDRGGPAAGPARAAGRGRRRGGAGLRRGRLPGDDPGPTAKRSIVCPRTCARSTVIDGAGQARISDSGPLMPRSLRSLSGSPNDSRLSPTACRSAR